MTGNAQNLSPQQNWQSLGAGGMYGSLNQGGAGTSVARSDLDAIRIGTGRIPTADYPDGYTSTIRSRREDRLLDSVNNRLNQKAYQRGVHNGSRVEPSAYFWPMEFNDQQGLRRQAKAQRTSDGYSAQRFAVNPLLTPAPHLVNDGKANTIANEPGTIDQRRVMQMSYLRPVWS